MKVKELKQLVDRADPEADVRVTSKLWDAVDSQAYQERSFRVVDYNLLSPEDENLYLLINL